MMNRIEEYLNSLDKKNKIILYLSIVIAGFVLYYNINLSYLQDEIDYNENVIASIKKEMKNTSLLKLKVKKKKLELKKLKKENATLIEDLKYLQVLIATSPILHIKEESFLEILRKILFRAYENGITASYEIVKDEGDYLVYNINIKGAFKRKDFSKFYSFIRSLESIKGIKSIDYLNIYKVENVGFEMNCKFWSIK